MSSTYQRRPRESLAVFDPFVLAGLRPNDALVGLPPLPDTPRHQSTASSASQGVVTAFFNRTMRNESVHPKSSHSRTGSRDRLIDVERWAVPPTATTTISRSNSQKNLSSPTKYPVLSTRQSSTAVPRQPTQIRQSPTKTASTRPSPTRSVNRDTISHSHAPSTRSVHRSRSLRNSSPPLVASASFQLPTSTSDASLIGDCSFAGAPSSSNGDDSIDLGIRDVRPALPAPSQLGYQRGEVEEGSTTPTKALVGVQGKEHSTVSRGSRSTLKPSRPMQNLNESNLLPSSPAKFADLLTSTNALARTEPPWSGSESTTTARAGITATSRATPARESPARRQDNAKNPTVSPNKRSTVAPRIPRQSPSTATMSSVKSKRTFPASSSGNSLASVGEEAGHLTNPDMSTLLPVSSAERVRHLLRDDGMILRETMFDEPSFRSPVKAVRATPSYNDMETKSIPDAGDVTFDVRDLMAKMNKPKRASGTEESFVDLLHGDGDLLVMGPDETFQLESIRPKPRPTAVGSPSPSRSVMPTSTSGHSLASASSRTSKSSRRRSSSLPELPQPNDLFSASRGPSPVKPEWLVSPGKLVDQATHVRQRSESRITASAIATPAARPRISMVPQSTGSRRISLSVGAIPSSAAASLRGIELNTARSYHSRDSSIHQTPSTGLGRPTSDVKPSTLAAKGTTATVRNRLGPAETIRTESKSRSGSTSTVRPTEAGRISFPPASRIAITGASTTRPQTIAARPAPARTPPVNVSHKVTAVATRARSIGLPQPGVGPTARSAPTATAQSRTFGANADSSINRLARPVISTLANRTKLSAGLAASPSKRDVPSVTSLKSRALSTPATAFTRQIIASQSRATRPPIELLKKQSMPASTGTGSTSALPKPRTGSTLPRPSTTRLPSPSGKMSNPPVGGLASLRERLDRLQVRAGK